ncbi:MAG: YraN family protein [Opitutaceae bacterium]|jgi:putative endonuclease|nr:YraN family protein [Opitutaceae bacterium]
MTPTLTRLKDRLLALVTSRRQKAEKQNSGAFGERQAADFLKAKGHKIIARNWRNPSDRREEIDLVCDDAGILVFVEVKTRAAGALVPGFYAVNPRKKRVLLRAAKSYMRRLTSYPRTFRFDIVEVETRPDASPEIRHFENIRLFRGDFRF